MDEFVGERIQNNTAYRLTRARSESIIFALALRVRANSRSTIRDDTILLFLLAIVHSCENAKIVQSCTVMYMTLYL